MNSVIFSNIASIWNGGNTSYNSLISTRNLNPKNQLIAIIQNKHYFINL